MPRDPGPEIGEPESDVLADGDTGERTAAPELADVAGGDPEQRGSLSSREEPLAIGVVVLGCSRQWRGESCRDGALQCRELHRERGQPLRRHGRDRVDRREQRRLRAGDHDGAPRRIMRTAARSSGVGFRANLCQASSPARTVRA